MIRYTEKIERRSLDIIPLRGTVAFPSIPLSFEISDDIAKQTAVKAKQTNSYVFLLAVKDPTKKAFTAETDFYTVGTVAKVKEYLKLPDGSLRIIVEGSCRAGLISLSFDNNIITADIMCKTINVENNGGIKGEAMIREVQTIFDEFVKYLPKISSEIMLAVKTVKSPSMLSDFIACNILVKPDDKQSVLEEYDPIKRLELLSVIMEKEIKILDTEMKIHKTVLAQIEENQRDYYLREQLKAIQVELGYGDADNEIDEYYELIDKAALPEEVQTKLEKEVRKLQKMPYNSAESSVIRTYLDTCLELPWNKSTKDRLDLETAEKILERDHDGLEKVKKLILEFLAVKKLNPELKNQILCLVGPPGTGKTSIAQSIANAMKRKYVRVALGGIRDEADIRGHRKTYIGSMPGRIITAINNAGVKNPLILLDEIDKLTSDAHGDPSSALLEVLDSEQNKNFRDHFIELPFDLSDCLFIATANTVETVPRPLLDRMEIIEIKSYTRHEKLMIAKNHLIPKQLKRHGLKKRQLKITDSAVYELTDNYTKEAGVRNLEREIASICRKVARKIVDGNEKSCTVSSDNIEEYLGKRKFIPDELYPSDEVGTVNGLAYTEAGGDLLRIEAAVMPGTGKTEFTGSLGDVMKESAHAAVSYIRQHSNELGIAQDFYKTKDIHIHVPEGAIPKDGPSAGVTMVTALVSELTGKRVRRDIAMTGEITLRGRVLAIGGLREKTMAAFRAGVKTVLLPSDNRKDLDNIDTEARDNLEFIFCSTLDDVLNNAFASDSLKEADLINEIRPEAIRDPIVIYREPIPVQRLK